jgi:hypothetical protein
MPRTKTPAVETHARTPYSRMIRKIVIGILALAVACILTTVFFFDAIASRVISTAGTRVLGVTTTVRSTHLGLLDGKSSVSGLKIAEPNGFGDGSMISVETASVTAGLSKLLGPDIVIDELSIDGVTVNLVEVNGQVNLQVVATNLTSTDTKDNKSAGTVTIRQLKVTNIKVFATGDTVLVGSKPVAVTIPDILISDIGTKTPASEVAAQISTQLMNHLLVAIVEAKIVGLPQSMMSGLSSASSSLGNATASFLKGSGTAIQNTINGAGDAIKSIFGGQ